MRLWLLTRLWCIRFSCLSADGVYTGEYSTMAICGFVRSMGESDGSLDRLWTKCYEDGKGEI